MPQRKRRARDKRSLPPVSATSKTDEIVREFAEACQKLLTDAFRKLAARAAFGRKRVSKVANEYREVPGYRGYRVNAKGCIQSCWGAGNRYIPEEWHTMQPFLAEGRRFVRLTKRGKRTTRQAATFVLRAFVSEPPPGKPYVRHLNNRMDDDRPENLEWSARKQQRKTQ